MGRYIDEILQPGEKVLYSTNAHWIFYLPAIAAWIEQHVGEVPAISAVHLIASPTNHFMIGDDSLAMAVQPDKRNSEGLMQRAGGC